jgi:hypothetical protein
MHGASALTMLALTMAPLGCGSEGEGNLKVERLPDVNPNLPAVPDLPPPPHPLTYSDGSYSVYGLRARMQSTIGEQVEVTGYIVDIYEPPECEDDERCETLAPHMWIADKPGEEDREKRLRVVGYADSHEQYEEALKEAERGTYEPPDPESGMTPIPTDFAEGNKVKVDGRFVHVSGAGFKSASGVLEYAGHETLEAVEESDS